MQTLVAGFIIYKAGGYLLHKLLNRSDKRKQLAIANAEEDELGSELDAEDVAEMYGGGLPEVSQKA